MFAKLIRFRALLSFPQLHNNAIAAVVVFVAVTSFSGHAFAQNIQPRPVARLVSAPGNTNYSRPRRVTPSDNFPVAVASKESPKSASISSAFEAATEIERHAFEKTNIARAANGLPPLVWDAELCRMARAHSERMATLGFFSHVTPEVCSSRIARTKPVSFTSASSPRTSRIIKAMTIPAVLLLSVG
ncbi:MAG TPA: CAP domain-containing protein [Pyrinomonadaceae bacterium]